MSTKVENTAGASAWTVTVGDNTHSVVVQGLIGAERARKISVDEGAFTTWAVPAPGYVTGPEGTFELTRITKATQLEAAAGAGSGSITSPMPGTVIAVEVESGSEVEEGQAVVVIEAMKMEHTLTAEIAGEVTVEVAVGDKVTTGQVPGWRRTKRVEAPGYTQAKTTTTGKRKSETQGNSKQTQHPTE